MPMKPEEVAAVLARTLGDRLLGVDPFEGTAGRVRFDRAAALAVFTAVRDELGFAHLAMVGGIDWVEHREVIYTAWSDDAKQYLFLSTTVPANDARVESASAVWPSAVWHEREAWEMVDITFEHHPDLRHLLMPDGYAFHPLLRSFKLHEPEELEVKARHV
ncbi:MAG TPA: NADH-quinone oxidoreductase subunit C [Thermoplasmata archaeon]|nr:NADH-quinone oxidoreductase subunit C [Thermoplasmata archaeon]